MNSFLRKLSIVLRPSGAGIVLRPSGAGMTLVALFFLTGSLAQAGLLFQYNRLALKDLDQMNALVQDKINESRKTKGDQVVPLKEALQAVYSRPNEDFMIEKVVSPLRNELDEHDAYENSMRALVKEANGALGNPKAFGAVPQVTYAIFLENVVAEFKPKASDNFERSILEDIRKAKITITKMAENERRLRMMKGIPSPSDLADQALKAQEEADKKKKEEAEKAEKTKKDS
ncbi:MAG: hypothetical protein ACK5P7_10795 [Bdellovibrio sp.]|jgi:hypothetical protein